MFHVREHASLQYIRVVTYLLKVLDWSCGDVARLEKGDPFIPRPREKFLLNVCRELFAVNNPVRIGGKL